MKNEKIYFENNPDALFYYRQLEANDKVDADCYFRHGDNWVLIPKDNIAFGRTIREIEEAFYLASKDYDVIIAKRFNNEN